jgi:hypothetical protein
VLGRKATFSLFEGRRTVVSRKEKGEGVGELGLVVWTAFPLGLQLFGQEKKTFAHAFVLLASSLYLSVLHEILKFVVSAQTQHFLAAAGRIPSPQRRLNDEEEHLEFIGFRAG